MSKNQGKTKAAPQAETDDLGLPKTTVSTEKQDDQVAAAKDKLDAAKANVAEAQVRAITGAPDSLSLLGEGRQIENTQELDVAHASRLRMQLRVKRVHPHAQLPQYHSAGAACFDLHSIDSGHVMAGGATTFATGLAFEVPEGFVMLVYSRSGHGFKNDVSLANCVGVIDSDYRGEIHVRLANANSRTAFPVEVGQRIAQAMLLPMHQWSIEEVEELSETARGEGRFGSTGE